MPGAAPALMSARLTVSLCDGLDLYAHADARLDSGAWAPVCPVEAIRRRRRRAGEVERLRRRQHSVVLACVGEPRWADQILGGYAARVGRCAWVPSRSA